MPIDIPLQPLSHFEQWSGRQTDHATEEWRNATRSFSSRWRSTSCYSAEHGVVRLSVVCHLCYVQKKTEQREKQK